MGGGGRSVLWVERKCRSSKCVGERGIRWSSKSCVGWATRRYG